MVVVVLWDVSGRWDADGQHPGFRRKVYRVKPDGQRVLRLMDETDRIMTMLYPQGIKKVLSPAGEGGGMFLECVNYTKSRKREREREIERRRAPGGPSWYFFLAHLAIVYSCITLLYRVVRGIYYAILHLGNISVCLRESERE